MKWSGPRTQIEILQKPDSLLIRATGLRYRLDALLPAIVFIGIAGVALFKQSFIAAIFALIVAIAGVLNWTRNRSAELTITENEVFAHGYLGAGSTGNVHLVWPEISGLKYRLGGRNSARGLVATTGILSSTCLIADLNQEQTNELIDTIYRRFPNLHMAEKKDIWSLFGKSRNPSD